MPRQFSVENDPDYPYVGLRDPSPEEIGPNLQKLMNQVGQVTHEELRPDLLWTTTAQVQSMTPEEIEETINGMQDPIVADPVPETPTTLVSPLNRGIQQLSGNLMSQNLEETKEEEPEPESIV